MAARGCTLVTMIRAELHQVCAVHCSESLPKMDSCMLAVFIAMTENDSESVKEN